MASFEMQQVVTNNHHAHESISLIAGAEDDNISERTDSKELQKKKRICDVKRPNSCNKVGKYETIAYFLCVVTFIAGFASVAYLWGQSTIRKGAEFTYQPDPWPPVGSENRTIAVDISFSQIDIITATVKARISPAFSDGLLMYKPTRGVPDRLNQDITLLTGNTVKVLQKGSTIGAIEVQLVLIRDQEDDRFAEFSFDGSELPVVVDEEENKKTADDYPFDKYVSYLPLSFYTGFGTSSERIIPVSIYFAVAVPSYNIRAQLYNSTKSVLSNNSTFDGLSEVPDAELHSPPLVINIRRSNTTIGFSIFLIITMWFTTLVAAANAVTTLIWRRKVEGPIPAYHATMVFALPTLRAAQPGVPPVGGAIGDAVGFFWNMALLSFGLVIIVWCYIRQHEHAPPPPPDVEKAKSS